jgi:hypothetical protein
MDVSPALQDRLGQDATTGLLQLLDSAREEWMPGVTTAATERFEQRLTGEVGILRAEIRELGTALRSEIRELATTLRSELKDGDNALRLEMRDLGASLRVEMQNDRFELLKWCFLFWVGQFFAVAGVLTVVVRLMRP